MPIEDAIADLTDRILKISPDAVIKTKKRNADEASIRVYAPAEHESAIKAEVQPITLSLLTGEGLDVQVLVYDIATSLPQESA
ncbi:MAG: hypothetical protein H7Z42_20930 [Roseiflexaceae bacterium]|nr:hypothetical protein [Roseiflexaceae bacterium]